MKTKGLKHKKLPLGLTFSFPCRQTKLEEVRFMPGREEAVQDLGLGLGNVGMFKESGWEQERSAGVFLFCFFLFLHSEVET